MSQGTFEFTGGDVFELTRLNRALAQLARPGSEEEWPQLRQELIKRLWSRKRQLLRQAQVLVLGNVPKLAAMFLKMLVKLPRAPESGVGGQQYKGRQ